MVDEKAEVKGRGEVVVFWNYDELECFAR